MTHETEIFNPYLSFEAPSALEPDLLDFKYELRCFWCCDIFKKIPFLSFQRCSKFCRHICFQLWRERTGVEGIFPLGVSLSKRNINMADTEKSVKIEEGDPQSVQDLTGFVPFDVQHVSLFVNFIPGLNELSVPLTNVSLVIVVRLHYTANSFRRFLLI